MSRTDFYILPTSTNLLHFACQLINKIWKKENTIYIHAQSADQAEALDDLLWVFHDTSFVPHERVQKDQSATSPIAIGCQGSNETDKQVLINLSDQIPDFITSFTRIAEIVDNNTAAQLETARLRYAEYRKRGFELHHHRIQHG